MTEKEIEIQKALGTFDSYCVQCPKCGNTFYKRTLSSTITFNHEVVREIGSSDIDYIPIGSSKMFTCAECGNIFEGL